MFFLVIAKLKFIAVLGYRRKWLLSLNKFIAKENSGNILEQNHNKH